MPHRLVGLAVLAFLLLQGCAPARPLRLEPLARLEPKTPVLLLPGFTGSKLRDPATGKVIWGSAGRFFSPRDGGYSLALPLDPAARDAQSYEAYDVVRKIRIGPVVVDIYGKFLDLLEANGYRLGDLDDPRPDDTLFVFPYDWRLNNVDAAATLLKKLERVRQARGEPVLRLHVVCHSNAARIARYVMKYGGAALEDAEAGRAGPPSWLRVEKLLLIGTANGGATNGFRNFLQGRSYVPVIGRKFRPEVAFTFDAAFETLPAYRTDLFFDANGRLLTVDLFDAANWQLYGWSVFDPRTAKRLCERGRDDLFGTAEQRRAHLERNLDRARRLHSVLRRDVPHFPETSYYLVQNAYRETADRIMLARDKDGEWRTFFYPQRRVRRAPLFSLASTPGDGHASVLSQQWLSPQELDSFDREPLYVPVYHRTIIHHPTTHRAILDYLLE